jgi:hypothetical protein
LEDWLGAYACSSPPSHWCADRSSPGNPLEWSAGAPRSTRPEPCFRAPRRSSRGLRQRSHPRIDPARWRPSPTAAQRIRHHPRRAPPFLLLRSGWQQAATPRRRAEAAFQPAWPTRAPPCATATSARLHQIPPVSASNPAPLHLHLRQLSPAHLGKRCARKRSSANGNTRRRGVGSAVEPRTLLCAPASTRSVRNRSLFHPRVVHAGVGEVPSSDPVPHREAIT